MENKRVNYFIYKPRSCKNCCVKTELGVWPFFHSYKALKYVLIAKFLVIELKKLNGFQNKGLIV